MLENFTATVKPGTPSKSWDTPHNAYRVTLRNPRGNTYTVSYYMGLGLQGEPTPLDVLQSLASDAASVRDSQSFEEWCGDLGYDSDSRTAHKTFKACKRVSDRLESFLTAEEFDAVLELDR